MNINPVREKERTQTEIKQRHFELVQMWPRNTWGTSVQKHRLDENTICDCCHAYATRIAITNIWGTVCEVYCCEKHHKQVDGTWRDNIPNEKKAENVA